VHLVDRAGTRGALRSSRSASFRAIRGWQEYEGRRPPGAAHEFGRLSAASGSAAGGVIALEKDAYRPSLLHGPSTGGPVTNVAHSGGRYPVVLTRALAGPDKGGAPAHGTGCLAASTSSSRARASSRACALRVFGCETRP
jgi:hypothetical protein